MVYTKKGSIITLEENGLKIFINYDKVMGRIDEEINNSYIYSKGTEDKNLYFFGKKDISQELYIHSLIGIKTLIDKMFCDTPTINIFDFIPITKKGTFHKNRVVNIASPIAGLFFNYDYYKYIETFSLQSIVDDEKNVRIIFTYLQGDVNKFEPIFFEDYTKPIIRTKLSAIKRVDLKPGMIYSDEKQKKFFLFLGQMKLIEGDNYYGGIYKKSKVLLTKKDFSDDEILLDIEARRKKQKDFCLRCKCKYNEKAFTYIKLTKKEFETIKKLDEKKDFEEFIRNCLINNKYYISPYENPIRVFHEEFEYLENIKPFEIIHIQDISFLDNVSGPIFHGGLDRDYYSICRYNYLKYE